MVSFASPTAATKNKRQSVIEYLQADGTFTDVEADAAIFGLTSNGLLTGDGDYFVTQPGVNDIVFAATAATAVSDDIDSLFAEDAGVLTWTNGNFTITDNNEAVFAISAGTLYAAFSTLPAGFTTVALSASGAPTTTSCTSSSSAVTTSSSSSSSAPITSSASLTSSSASGAPSSTANATSPVVKRFNKAQLARHME